MKPKYWTILILASAVIIASLLYYLRQPAPYSGPVVVPHVAKTQPQDGTTSQADVIASTSPQTQSDTSIWKTYINSQYGFSFQYPSNMNVQDGSSPSDFYVFANYKDTPAIEEGGANYSVLIEPTNFTNLDSWFTNEYKGRDASSLPTKAVRTEFGESALYISDPISEGGCGGEIFVILKNGYSYSFIDPTCSNDPNVIKLNSTFKFTN